MAKCKRNTQTTGASLAISPASLRCTRVFYLRPPSHTPNYMLISRAPGASCTIHLKWVGIRSPTRWLCQLSSVTLKATLFCWKCEEGDALGRGGKPKSITMQWFFVAVWPLVTPDTGHPKAHQLWLVESGISRGLGDRVCAKRLPSMCNDRMM